MIHRLACHLLFPALLFLTLFSAGQKLTTPVSIHEFTDFTGSGYSFKNMEMATFGDWWNKNISAVRVPAGYKAILYTGINYQGASLEITGNWSSLINKGWDNSISSIRIIETSTPVNKPVVITKPPTDKPVEPTKLILTDKPVVTEKPVIIDKTDSPGMWLRVRYFDEVGFTGTSEDLYVYDAGVLGTKWDKKIGSIEVPAGYRMICYDSANAKGQSIEISGNWTATGQYAAWNNRISAFRLLKDKAVVKPIEPVIAKEKEIDFKKQFVRISTKQAGRSFNLDYFPDDKKFRLSTQTLNWKIVAVAPNKYKLLLGVKGKYWALSSTPDAFPRLEDDSSGKYQFWQIEKLPDGFYRISNWALAQNNSPYPNLFYDSAKNNLFMTRWDDAKSLNGRWSLLSGGAIPIGEQPDPFDKKEFRLVSASTNKTICLTSYLMGGDISTTVIGNCRTDKGKINFIKTYNGDYMIRMNLEYSPSKYYYLNESLKTVTTLQVDILKPDPKHTWKLTPVGDGTYRISNTASKKVVELSKTVAGNLLFLITPSDRLTQQWILLQ